jgi:hypothetical protein
VRGRRLVTAVATAVLACSSLLGVISASASVVGAKCGKPGTYEVKAKRILLCQGNGTWRDHSAVKVNAACPKRGLITSGKGPRLRCTATVKGLRWVRLESTGSTGSSQPATGPFKPSVTSAAFNGKVTLPPSVVVDTIDIRSATAVAYVRVDVIAPDGSVSFVATAELALGTKLDGRWRAVLEVPKTVRAGDYIRRYVAFSATGEEALLMEFPFYVADPRSLQPTTCGRTGEGACPEETITASPDISSCKVRDASSPDDFVSIGFPRPPSTVTGRAIARVLVIPHEYADVPFEADVLEYIKEGFANAREVLLEHSYGKLDVQITVPERSKWVSIPEPWDRVKDSFDNDLIKITQNVISRAAEQTTLTGYNAIFILTSKSSAFHYGGGDRARYTTPTGTVGNVYYTVGGDLEPLPHPLGHALLGFEDLYLFAEARAQRPDFHPAAFDFMGQGSSSDGLSGWHRWISGWLEDDEVACVAPGSSGVIRLEHLAESSGRRLLVVPMGPGRAVLAEYRSSPSMSQSGLWLYWLDSNFPHGGGPLEGERVLLNVGEAKTYKTIRFEVLAAADNALYFRISY